MPPTFKSDQPVAQPSQRWGSSGVESSQDASGQPSASSLSVTGVKGDSAGLNSAASSLQSAERLQLDVANCITGKGGGALRSIDQKFSVNPSKGTLSLKVPFPVTPGRNGFNPDLSLEYDSGSGNGAFGVGWRMSTQSITRKTSHSIPRYLEDDHEFVTSDSDDLILLSNIAATSSTGYSILKYKLRIERDQTFRIEKWTNVTNSADVFWRTISGENITQIYGRNDNSRVFEGHGAHKRVFSWLICESYDPFGNSISYSYKAENEAGIRRGDEQPQMCEMNRDAEVRSRARYPKSLKYGNRIPCRDLDTWSIDPALLQTTAWFYEVVFDYGEHDHAFPQTTQTKEWDLRSDPFSSFQAGFEIRTYRLCRRILMFHHFPEKLCTPDYLVSSMSFTYDELATGALLTSIIQSSHVFDNRKRQYLTESIGPMTINYSKLPGVESLQVDYIKPRCLQTLPVSSPQTITHWLDLDAEGSPGLLVQSQGAWYYQRNETAVNFKSHDAESESESESDLEVLDDFGRVRQLSVIPSVVDQTKTSFEDLDGSGNHSLIVADEHGRDHGYYDRRSDDAEGEWLPFQQFESIPTQRFDSELTKRIDLTKSGVQDVLMMGKNGDMLWQESLGRKGFGAVRRCQTSAQSTHPRLLVANDYEATYLADMCGDGLEDIVQISNERVSYWPNLGYGRFGHEVVMDNSPHMDSSDLFSFERLRLLDVDGSGTKDMLYIQPGGGVMIYFNQCGNSWSQGTHVSQFPDIDRLSDIFALDIHGSGTTSLCWVGADGSSTDDLIIRYLDFSPGVKPHLVTSLADSRGIEKKVSYRPSTHFFLRDERAGRPWETKLPFPVHVVSKIVERDTFALSKRVTKYAYHQGYYDGDEQEFCGFGMVESWRYDEISLIAQMKPFRTPTKHDKMWFHTGSPQLPLIPNRVFGKVLTHTVISEDLDAFCHQQALRSLRGSEVRVETYGLDGTAKEAAPYCVKESTYDVDMLIKSRNKESPGSFRISSRESIYISYEREKEEARIEHNLILAKNKFGDTTKSAQVLYSKNRSFLDDFQSRFLQERPEVTYTETTYTKCIDSEHIFYKPLVAETNVVRVLNPPLPTFVNITTARKDPSSAFSLLHAKASTSKTAEIIQGDSSRILYLSADLSKCLAPGLIEPGTVIVGQRFDLCLEKGELNSAYGHDISDEYLSRLREEGGYCDIEGNGNWWIPSSRTYFGTHDSSAGNESELLRARRSFFTPSRNIDPFKNESIVKMDPYCLLPVEAEDCLGNVTVAANSYRTLQPVKLTDPNGNRIEIYRDTYGNMTAMSRMGKDNEKVGDDYDYQVPIVVPTATLRGVMSRPTKEALQELMGDWGKRWMFYHGILEDGGRRLPPFLIELARTQHLFSQEASSSDIAMTITYFNNHGSKIQTSTLVSWGDGSQEWCISDCTVYNMDNKIVKVHQPFMSSDHFYKSHLEIESPSTFEFTDVLDRNVGTLHPNHTWSKNTFAPWFNTKYQPGDTININPQADSDVGPYFNSLPHSTFLPSWLDLHRNSDAKYRIAAERSGEDSLGAPTMSHLDVHERAIVHIQTSKSLSRTFKSEYDINGHKIYEMDAQNRLVQHSQYDRQGHRLFVSNMDSGRDMTVYDCMGHEVLRYNRQGASKHFIYDALRRQVQVRVREAHGASEYLWSQTEYGEGEIEAETKNLRGKIANVYDQSGVKSFEYDFKGNILLETTQLTSQYKGIINWDEDVEKDSTIYLTKTTYDALDRPCLSIDPLGRHKQTTFNLNGGMVGLKTKEPEDKYWTTIISNITHTADDLPSTIRYGNKSTTSYSYDTSTRHILTKKTTSHSGSVLEDLSYTYDAISRLVFTADGAQNSIAYRNNLVRPEREYRYDPWGRLVMATGREMVSGRDSGSLTNQANRANPLAKMGLSRISGQVTSYKESYTYDDADNMLTKRHEVADGVTAGWTRVYTYEEPSLIDPGKFGNRLSYTHISGRIEKYSYDSDTGEFANGCTTSMPGFSQLQWDCTRKLKAVSCQRISKESSIPETTWYVYDSNGKRVRKVTEMYASTGKQQNVKLKETIFLNESEIFLKYAGDGTTSTITKRSLVGNRSNNHDHVVIVERTEEEGASSSTLLRYSLSPNLEVDNEARVVSYEEYCPFGESTFVSCGADIKASSVYRFASYRRDKETGFYHCGARLYLPHLGRWLSPDPLDTSDGPNTYCYCGNDPVNWVDPEGTIRDTLRGMAQQVMKAPVKTIGSALASTGIAAVVVHGVLGAGAIATAGASVAVGLAVGAAVAYTGYQNGAQAEYQRVSQRERIRDLPLQLVVADGDLLPNRPLTAPVRAVLQANPINLGQNQLLNPQIPVNRGNMGLNQAANGGQVPVPNMLQNMRGNVSDSESDDSDMDPDTPGNVAQHMIKNVKTASAPRP